MAETKKKGISGTGLKLMAILLMLIDHGCTIIMDRYLESVVPYGSSADELSLFLSAHPDLETLNSISLFLHLITRISFPLFVFLISEGYDHTRSVKKYVLNLSVFAIISEIPYNLAFEGRIFAPERQNVLFTLLFGVLCITFIRYLKKTLKETGKNILLYILSSLLMGFACMHVILSDLWITEMFDEGRSDGQVFIIGSAVIFIVLSAIGLITGPQKRKEIIAFILPIVIFGMSGDILKTSYGFCGVAAIAMINTFRKKQNLAMICSLFMLGLLEANALFGILAIIPVMEYNGQRGAKMNKYIFYAFYPAHLLMIYLIAMISGIAAFSLR